MPRKPRFCLPVIPTHVFHASGSTPVTVNQQTNGGQWNLLGTYPLDGASRIELTDVANGYVIADAIRIVATAGAPTTVQALYLHTDHEGTPRLATNATGNVVWRWDGTAFGETAPNPDPDGDGNLTTVNLRYPGQYFDAETGLHYNWNRYYDPKTGRYITSDPMSVAEHVVSWQASLGTLNQLPQELNTYAYALNDPLSRIDPFGLDITVSFNPNAAAGFGHVGIGVNTPNTVGQRPQPGASTIQTGLGLNVPGKISADPAAPSNITIPTTPAQDRNAQQCIDTRTQQQQDYNLYNNNCTQFARQCLGAAGINTPNTIFPRTLFNNLQQNLGGNP